ncbi:MAG TPA: hypothetical protein VFK20_12830 [Vicinamibacterales bacterium]|nr:hypothetical protein [Vicinamibacterales bacterium]
MDAADVYASVLVDLNAALLAMTSPRFDALLQKSPQQQRVRALRQLVDVQHARLVFGNAVLREIAGRLERNEDALATGQAAARRALERLDNLPTVLRTVGRLLTLVGRVVPLV